jgi:hypothetical protein
MLNVTYKPSMLSVVMLSAVAPRQDPENDGKKFFRKMTLVVMVRLVVGKLRRVLRRHVVVQLRHRQHLVLRRHRHRHVVARRRRRQDGQRPVRRNPWARIQNSIVLTGRK